MIMRHLWDIALFVQYDRGFAPEHKKALPFLLQ